MALEADDGVRIRCSFGAIALCLSWLTRVDLVYHEHDAPARSTSAFGRSIARSRKALARRAALCVLPSVERVQDFRRDTAAARTVVVWNCPLVSDLPAWRTMSVNPGFALACNPASADSIAAAWRELHDHPERRIDMGERGHRQILHAWNYETAFGPADSRIASLPPVAHEDVVTFLSAYDAVVVPSQWMETGPRGVYEAAPARRRAMTIEASA
jgi:hypothetical protein